MSEAITEEFEKHIAERRAEEIARLEASIKDDQAELDALKRDEKQDRFYTIKQLRIQAFRMRRFNLVGLVSVPDWFIEAVKEGVVKIYDTGMNPHDIYLEIMPQRAGHHKHIGRLGDWIVRDEKGILSIVADKTFEETYQFVESISEVNFDMRAHIEESQNS